jgi:hypothetical protein
MPKLPSEPYFEGDLVEVIDHQETRENTSYAHLIGDCATVINPEAGSQAHGFARGLLAVQFPNGEVEAMFHWRFKLIKREVMWEV